MKDELPDLELFLKKKGGNSQGRGDDNAPGKTDISQKLSALVKKPGTSTGSNPSVPASMSPSPSISPAPSTGASESPIGINKPNVNGNNNGQESPIGLASDKPVAFSSEASSQSAWSAATSSPNIAADTQAQSPGQNQADISTSITSSTTGVAGSNRPNQPNVKGPQAMPMSTLSSSSAPSLLKAPSKQPGRPAQPYSYKPVIEPGRELMAPKAPSSAPTAKAPQPMMPKPASVVPASKPVVTPAPTVKSVETASASPLNTAMPSKTPLSPPSSSNSSFSSSSPAPTSSSPSGRVETDAEKLARAFREEAQALQKNNSTNSAAGIASGAPHASFDDSLDPMDENVDEDLLNNSFFEDEGPVNAQNIQSIESVENNDIGVAAETDLRSAFLAEEAAAAASQAEIRSAFLAEEAAAAAASAFSATSANPAESAFKNNEVHGDGPKASLSNLFDSGVLNSRYGDDAPSKPLGFGNLLAGSAHDDDLTSEDDAKHTTFADLMVPTGEHDALFAPDRRQESGPSALEQITAQLTGDSPFKAPENTTAAEESSAPAFGSLFSNEIVTTGRDFSHNAADSFDSDLLEPEEAQVQSLESDYLDSFGQEAGREPTAVEHASGFADNSFNDASNFSSNDTSNDSFIQSFSAPASEPFTDSITDSVTNSVTEPVNDFASEPPSEVRSPKSLAISKLLEAVNQTESTAPGVDSSAPFAPPVNQDEPADLMFSDKPVAPTGLGNLLGSTPAAPAQEEAPVRSAFDISESETSPDDIIKPVEGDFNTDGLSAKALEALAAFAPTVGEEQHETKGLLKKLKARDAAEKAALKASSAKGQDATASGDATLAKKEQEAKELKEAKQLKEAQELKEIEEAKALEAKRVQTELEQQEREAETRRLAEREAAAKWAAEEDAAAKRAAEEEAAAAREAEKVGSHNVDAGSLASLLASVTPPEELAAKTPTSIKEQKEEQKEEEKQEEDDEDDGNSLGDAISDALDKLLGEAGGEKADGAGTSADPAHAEPTKAEKDKAYFDRFEQPINSKHHDLAGGDAPKAAPASGGITSLDDDENDRFNRPINNPLRKVEEKLEETVTAASTTDSPVASNFEAPAEHPMTLTNSKVDALSRLLEVASKAPEKSNDDKNKASDSANQLAQMINKPPGKVSRQVETMPAPEPKNDNFSTPYGGGTSPFSSPGASYSGPGAVNSPKPGRDAASPFGTAVNSSNSGVSLNHTPAGGFSPTGQASNSGFNNPGGVGAASMTDMPKASGIASDAVQARIAALNRALDEQNRGPGGNSGTAASVVPGPSLAPPPMEPPIPPPLISNPAPDFVPNPIVDGSAQTRAELMNRILGSAKISQTAMPDGATRQEMAGEQSLAQLQANKAQKNSQKGAQANNQKNSPPKSKARAHGGSGGLNPKTMIMILGGLLILVAGGYFAVQKGVINLKAMDMKGFDMGKAKGSESKQSIDQMIKAGDTDKAIEALEAKKESGKLSNSENEKLSGLYYSTAEKAYSNDDDPVEAIKQLEKIPSKSKKYKDAQRLMRKLKKKVKKG